MMIRMTRTVRIPNAPPGTILRAGWEYPAEMVGAIIIAECPNGQKIELPINAAEICKKKGD